MSVPPSDDGAPGAPGPLRQLASIGLSALVTRGELASLELTEERERAARWVAMAMLAAVLLLAALIVAALWVVSLFWDSHRAAAFVVVALVYAAGGVGIAAWLAARLRNAPPLLEGTLAELKRDRDAFRGSVGQG